MTPAALLTPAVRFYLHPRRERDSDHLPALSFWQRRAALTRAGGEGGGGEGERERERCPGRGERKFRRKTERKRECRTALTEWCRNRERDGLRETKEREVQEKRYNRI